MQRNVDVVVVGAGLAGLSAALTCVRQGLKVQVLEAKGRVGGRTLTVTRNGLRLDLGAEWVVSDHHRDLTRELQLFGIELAEAAPPAEVTWALGTTVVNRPSVLNVVQQRLLTHVCSAIERDAAKVDFSNPRWFEGLLDYDIPFSSYLASLTPESAVRDYILLNAFALFGADENDYSALHVLHEIAGFGSCAEAFEGETDRIEGGAASLANAMAVALGDRVALDTPVRAVHAPDGSGPVVVHLANGRALTARTAIITVPLNVLQDLDLQMPLTAGARSAIEAGHVGACVKVWTSTSSLPVPYLSYGWPDVPESYGRPTPDRSSQEVAAFQVVDASGTRRAVEDAMAELHRRHPEADFSEDLLVHDWQEDPYARGTWYTPGLGQIEGVAELAAHPGPCFFSGGDISRRWAGWMDGAVSSGKDAASRAAALLQGRTVPPPHG